MAPVSERARDDGTAAVDALAAALETMLSEDLTARKAAFGAVLQLGMEKAVDSLAARLVEPGQGDDAAARMALHGLAVHAARPGSEDRAAFAAAVAARLAANAPPGVKRFLLEALQLTARDEAVSALAALLPDPDLAEPARAALQANPAPAALEALRKALPTARGALRVGIIHGLGDRGDAAGVEALLAEAGSRDPEPRRAAFDALGRIGDPRAEPVLTAALATEDRDERRAAVEGLLRFAERCAASGRRADAERVHSRLLEVHEDHVLAAALRGLGATGSAGAVPRIAPHLASGEAAVRRQAADALAALAGEGVQEAIEEAHRAAAGDLKAVLDEVLARRKGARAF